MTRSRVLLNVEWCFFESESEVQERARFCLPTLHSGVRWLSNGKIMLCEKGAGWEGFAAFKNQWWYLLESEACFVKRSRYCWTIRAYASNKQSNSAAFEYRIWGVFRMVPYKIDLLLLPFFKWPWNLSVIWIILPMMKMRFGRREIEAKNCKENNSFLHISIRWMH